MRTIREILAELPDDFDETFDDSIAPPLQSQH
jgi:hypothetical protein